MARGRAGSGLEAGAAGDRGSPSGPGGGMAAKADAPYRRPALLPSRRSGQYDWLGRGHNSLSFFTQVLSGHGFLFRLDREPDARCHHCFHCGGGHGVTHAR
ncbi:hypothetical protein B5X24_HaOG205911 [Helicoverpa armigera]|uniref:Uncharacterized protein n=1 Tax=Helicoverpa armigera TaxID=29058 RepID=A0A2W1BPZ3_HELAM|nr:hypothetical protein B5X24_HaOG205911 [Helicoverpa armigera]